MSKELHILIEKARSVRMSPDDKESQRRSFAYGNTHIENGLITRDTVDRAAEKIKNEQGR
ncbi:MAG: hypothetical protein RIB84_21915 [Sneathiellaceae bacterium]